MSDIIPHSSQVLMQLKGRVKFDQLNQITPNVWRGFNDGSDLIMDIVINPINFFNSLVSIGISDREYNITPKSFLVNGVSSIYQLLDLLQWRAKEIMEFEYYD